MVKDNQIAGSHLIVDIFATCADVDLKEISIQESEVAEIAWVSLNELLNLDISTTCSYIKELALAILDVVKEDKWIAEI